MAKTDYKFTDKSSNVKGSIAACEKKGLQEAAKIVRAAAKARVPVRTGGLKKAIATWVKKDLSSGGFSLIIGVYNAAKQKARGIKRAPHAHLIEFGTSKSGAKPFLRPSVENNLALIREAIARGMSGVTDTDEYKDWLKKAKEEAEEDD